MGGLAGDAEGEVRGGGSAHHRLAATSPSTAAGKRVDHVLHPKDFADDSIEGEDTDSSHLPPRQWITWKLRGLFFWCVLWSSMPNDAPTRHARSRQMRHLLLRG